MNVEKNMHVEKKLAPLQEVSGEAIDFSKYYDLSHIGCDETGSTDFFGPLCVVACYIDERDFDWLTSLNLCNPANMSLQEIIDIARQIKDRLVYSLLILDNSHYNKMAAEGHNLANIKAKLYNQAITNVMQKISMQVEKKIANQFVSPKTYFNYLKNEVIVVKDLDFEKDAVSTYPAIMVASILSKYAYYQYFNNMSRSLKIKIPRGTASGVEQVAAEISHKYGQNMLLKVAKTNMTCYKRVKDLL